MKMKIAIILTLLASAALPLSAGGKKKGPERGMLEKMEAVPCGAKEKGLSGLGSVWASVGITDVHTDQKLCPQYLLRTDEMDYHIRPKDLKHAVVLPVGNEVVFKVKKNSMYLKDPNGGKTMMYEVVAMEPASTDSNAPSASEKSPPDKP
jgi:hypothetical protein